MIDLNNTTANIRRIANTPESELGEGGPAIIFDIPADLDYGGNEIDEVLWNGRQILLWYSPPEFDIIDIHFNTKVEDNTIIITGYSPGLLTANEVYNQSHKSSHAESLELIYDWFQSEGIEFADLEQVASSQ